MLDLKFGSGGVFHGICWVGSGADRIRHTSFLALLCHFGDRRWDTEAIQGYAASVDRSLVEENLFNRMRSMDRQSLSGKLRMQQGLDWWHAMSGYGGVWCEDDGGVC